MKLLPLALIAAVAAGTAGAAGRSGTGRELGSVRLDTPSRGLASASIGPRRELLITRDGGLSWRNVAPPRIQGGIDDWSWLDERRGWIVTSDCVGKGGVAVYRTADGGRTWRRTPRLTSISCAAGSNAQLVFADSRRGWLFHVELVRHLALLWRTADGGRTWAPPAQLPLRGEIRFTSARDGWLASGVWRTQQAVFVTRDGGRTWSRKRLTLPAGYETAQAYYDVPTFFGSLGVLPVTLLSPRRSAAVFYVSANGGKTWRLRAIRPVELAWRPHNPFAWRAPAAIGGPRTWWLVSGPGRDRVEVTTDGGRTWRRTASRLVRRFATVSASGRAAWLVTGGDNRRLYATSDAGRTWRRLTP